MVTTWVVLTVMNRSNRETAPSSEAMNHATPMPTTITMSTGQVEEDRDARRDHAPVVVEFSA
jgi:hypothetical protein